MLTRTGAGVALAGVIFAVGGFFTGLPDFVLAGLGCLAGLALAGAWIVFMVADLSVQREIIPARMHEGDSTTGILHVANHRNRVSPPLAAVEVCAGKAVPVVIPRIAPHATEAVSYEIPPIPRGKHRIQPLIIGQSDPFRLLRRGSQQCGPSDLIVYPQVVPLRPLFTAGAIDADGPVTGGSMSQGEEFRSLRPYELGDDPRLIHWRSSARLGSLAVRVRVVPDQPQYVVAVDTAQSSYPGSAFDEAVRIAASLCTMADRAGFPLLVMTTSGSSVRLDPARAPAVGAARALDLLAEVSLGQADPGLPALGKYLRGTSGGVLVVVTGSQVDLQSLAPLPQLRRRYSVTVLVQTGEHRRSAVSPPRVRVIAPRTVREFAALWNSVVTP